MPHSRQEAVVLPFMAVDPDERPDAYQHIPRLVLGSQHNLLTARFAIEHTLESMRDSDDIDILTSLELLLEDIQDAIARD